MRRIPLREEAFWIVHVIASKRLVGPLITTAPAIVKTGALSAKRSAEITVLRDMAEAGTVPPYLQEVAVDQGSAPILRVSTQMDRRNNLT